MSWKTLDQMDFAGKVALVRVDINVPVEAGQVIVLRQVRDDPKRSTKRRA